MVGRCHPTLTATTVPGCLAGVPHPTDVPRCAAATTYAAAPPGGQGDVQCAVRQGGGAPESMGEGRGGIEEAAGEGGTGDG